ncbi:MAG: phosphorylase [Thalassobius sp.]|nr:phosphorylase [Thalassovita sp.]
MHSPDTKKIKSLSVDFPESELIINNDGSVYHLNLKPSDIAENIIVVGDPGRVHQVSRYFDTVDFEMNKREFITHTGTLNGKKITVISSGIGTDNVEILMTELDALASINFKNRKRKARRKKLKIVRIGTSGTMRADVKLDSHLVSVNAIGIDNLMGFYKLYQKKEHKDLCRNIKQLVNLPSTPYFVSCSETLLNQIGFDMVQGNTVTSPGFYAPQGRVLRAPVKTPDFLDKLTAFNEDGFYLSNFEMETAGYYAFGQMLKHDMLSVNAIIANRAIQKFSKKPADAIDSLIQKVLERFTS